MLSFHKSCRLGGELNGCSIKSTPRLILVNKISSVSQFRRLEIEIPANKLADLSKWRRDKFHADSTCETWIARIRRECSSRSRSNRRFCCQSHQLLPSITRLLILSAIYLAERERRRECVKAFNRCSWSCRTDEITVNSARTRSRLAFEPRSR